MFQKILLLASGNVAASALLFLRNILIARLISTEDYGIAATFAMVMAVAEMASQIGMHQLIVQDDEGDEPELQSSLQGFHLIRVAATAALMYFLAQPLASFMGIGHVAWAFEVLALPRLAYAFLHFDIYRLQRRMSYLPMMAVFVLTPAVALVLVIPLASIYGDYRVMLYSIVFQELGRVAFTHLVAERPYRLRFDTSVIKRAFSYGWPLLLNSLLLFVVYNGEKIVVGREIGMESLALFAMAITLTSNPSLIMLRIIEALFLPGLSSRKHEPDRFAPLAYATIQTTVVSGMVTVGATISVLIPLVPLLLGTDWISIVPYLYWLSLLQLLRDSKSVALLALATGKTLANTLANIPRVLVLPFAWFAATQGADLLSIIQIALVGEALGFLVGILLVQVNIGVSIRPIIVGHSTVIIFIILAVAYGLNAYGGGLYTPTTSVPAAFVVAFYLIGVGTQVWFWRLILGHRSISLTP